MQIWVQNFFFRGFYLYYMLGIFASYHFMQFQKKTNERNFRKWQKNLVSGPILTPWRKFGTQNFFSWILLLLHVRHCCKLSFYAISRKPNEPNLTKQQKTKISERFWNIWYKFGLRTFFFFFFFKKYGSASHQISWSTIIMYNIRKKLKIQS